MIQCMVPAVPAGSTFTIGWPGGPHKVGDPNCPECWGSQFPLPCADPKCPGLVHEEYVDESYDSIYTTLRCDLCGGDEHIET